MKRKRLLLILGCITAVLLAAYATLWLTRPNHKITDVNIDAIKVGMTEREVKALLGGSGKALAWGKTNGEWQVCKEWMGDELYLQIIFDEQGRVQEIYCRPLMNEDKSFLDLVRAWLGM
jgi:hypothetical protein